MFMNEMDLVDVKSSIYTLIVFSNIKRKFEFQILEVVFLKKTVIRVASMVLFLGPSQHS